MQKFRKKKQITTAHQKKLLLIPKVPDNEQKKG